MKSLFIIISFVFCASFAFANETDAVKALKMLQSRCAIGINYSEYTKALGEIHYEITECGTKCAKLQASMRYHLIAKEVWASRMGRGSPASEYIITYVNEKYRLPDDDQLFNLILEVCPDLSESVIINGGRKMLPLKLVLTSLWNRAQAEIPKK